MSGSIKAIVYQAHGKPEEVLRLEKQELPAVADDEALVRVLAAPINPADLNQIEGKYPIRSPLPATPGFEGAGVVEEVGSAVRDLAVGAQVILPHDLGTWREMAVVKAAKLVATPNDIAPEQAAMLKINPITAWRMAAALGVVVVAGASVWDLIWHQTHPLEMGTAMNMMSLPPHQLILAGFVLGAVGSLTGTLLSSRGPDRKASAAV